MDGRQRLVRHGGQPHKFVGVSLVDADVQRGKIEIEYYNKEDLDRLIDMILK